MSGIGPVIRVGSASGMGVPANLGSAGELVGGEERRFGDPAHSFSAALEAMHLQWFASPEEEGRTEEPTEHKIQKSRQEGKVAKSQDVTGAIILLFTVLTLAIFSGYLLNTMVSMIRYFYSRAAEMDVTKANAVMPAFYSFFIRLTLPVAAVAFVSAVMGNVIQVGTLFSLKPIAPDFNKIVPRFDKFIEKTFTSVEALYNWFKSMGKVILLGSISFLNIWLEAERLINLVHVPFMQAFGAVAGIAFRILMQAAIVMLLLSIFDFMFQKRQHTESLKMTKQEVKEERKTYEGDPMVKSRLRNQMQEMMSRNQLENVPQADVVVTNPTHFAIALEYNRETMVAPTVTAKGQDNMARIIRERAEEYEVPIIENKPLARALYSEVEIGDIIPEKFYEAVVAVLKEVYRMSGKKAGVVG
ncbi:MAG: flagellar biosynthesis protein FlhB [Spirochaetota bacterium]